MNTVTLTGNLTADPELRYTPSGIAVAACAVAVNRRVNRNGEWTDELEGFFDIVAWKHLGEHVTETLTKGDRVVITGRLSQNRWTDDDGTNRSRVEIIADAIGKSLEFGSANSAASDNPPVDQPV